MKPPTRLSAILACVVLLSIHAAAQIPSTLLHSVPAPSPLQPSAQLGSSMATDGSFTAAGAYFDDTGATNAGVVKVFDSTTGALLHVIPNPDPGADDGFGQTVALAGNRLIVGVPSDDTTAVSAGIVYVYDLGSATPTVPALTLTNPSPTPSGDYFGTAVAISGSVVVAGAAWNVTGGSDAGSAYVFDLAGASPTVPIVTLHNPLPNSGDQFGRSAAVSGQRVVIGAYLDDTGATNTGIAYVYDIGGPTPTTPVAVLNNPTPADSDFFGESVAISGTRVVIGAYSDDTNATNTGSAYVYDLASATPTTPVLTLNNPEGAAGAFQEFGSAVAVLGDQVLAGTLYGNHPLVSWAGSVSVYDMGSAIPSVPILTLDNPDPHGSDWFGFALAISTTRVVVGAPGDDTSAPDSGSAYLFDLASATPTTALATLNNPGPELPATTDDEFGRSVAMSGNWMIAGAYRDDTGRADAASAFVYNLASAMPTMPVHQLRNPQTPFANDAFGYAVAMDGQRFVVGAHNHNGGAVAAGGAYVYDLTSSTPTYPVIFLNNPAPEAGDNFGFSVAISGTRVVVGAWMDATGAPGAGSAYVYDLASATPSTPVAVLNNPAPEEGDRFGHSVAISGTKVVVSAYLDEAGAHDAGTVYVYDLASATPTTPVLTIFNPSPAAGDLFGRSLAISGARVVVGANRDDTGATDSGIAYVYDLASATPSMPVLTLNNPTPGADDNFGQSAAIIGDRVVIGAQNDDASASEEGTVYVYDLASATPATPISTIHNPVPNVGDQFGFAVGADGNKVVVGAPFDDAVGLNKGYAYVFGVGLPEIAVEQPVATDLTDGSASISFGTLLIGSSGTPKTFEIKNIGTGDLTGLAVTKDGSHASQFTVGALGSTTVSPGGSTTFNVTFAPGGTATGTRTAALHITSNDDDENPFDIALTGTALSFSTDTDGDGMNDASEFQLAALGYDWQVTQTVLVNTLTSNFNGLQPNLNAAGFYTTAQVQALNLGTPLIQRHPVTGVFTLTIGVEKSTTLAPASFAPFPMTAPQTLINGAGKLEFQFTVPDNAAFFQLRAE